MIHPKSQKACDFSAYLQPSNTMICPASQKMVGSFGVIISTQAPSSSNE